MDSYTIEEIESSLMAQEARFEKNNKALDFVLSANIATKFQGQGNLKKWQSNNFGGQGQRQNSCQGFNGSQG